MRTFHLLRKILFFILLTLLTQVGGLIYLLLFPVFSIIRRRWTGRFAGDVINCLVFIVVYTAISLMIVPLLARASGRVALPLTSHNNLVPQNVWTCLLNRNYVRPELKEAAEKAALNMNKEFPGTVVHYLDASFPFINKYPLFPHLSHNDGRKLDLSFCYLDSKSGLPTNKTPAPLGYGICEEPRPGEKDQPCFCGQQGYWQYSFMRKIIPQNNKKNFIFDSVRTKQLVLLFIADPRIGKIFIEPHLKTRLELQDYDKIRYHGCHAVRHDDHVHVQL